MRELTGSQWPLSGRVRRSKKKKITREQFFYMMLPRTKLLCPVHGELKRVQEYKDGHFRLECGCRRKNKLDGQK